MMKVGSSLSKSSILFEFLFMMMRKCVKSNKI